MTFVTSDRLWTSPPPPLHLTARNLLLGQEQVTASPNSSFIFIDHGPAMSGHGLGTCCGNYAFMEVARLTGENTRLQFESTRIGGELTRLSDEITRLRDEKSELAAEVKRLTDAATEIPKPAPPSPGPEPPPPMGKKYIYLMNPAYEFSTTSGSSNFLYGKITSCTWDHVKTKDGDFLLGSEVSPQGAKMRDSVLIFDKMIIDTDGFTFVREFP